MSVVEKLANPYLAAFQAAEARCAARVERIRSQPGYKSSDVWNARYNFERFCGRLVLRYAFAIPTEEVIREIAKWSPIVEIGSGSGYWAWMLDHAGAKVHAYDPTPDFYPWRQFWVEPKKGGAERLWYHQDCAVLLCWPLYDEDIALEAAKRCQRRLVYVGEWRGNSANEEFFDFLDEHYEETGQMEIPQRPHMKDAVHFFERKYR